MHKQQVGCSNNDDKVQNPDCLIDRFFVLRLVEGDGEANKSEGGQQQRRPKCVWQLEENDNSQYRVYECEYEKRDVSLVLQAELDDYEGMKYRIDCEKRC